MNFSSRSEILLSCFLRWVVTWAKTVAMSLKSLSMPSKFRSCLSWSFAAISSVSTTLSSVDFSSVYAANGMSVVHVWPYVKQSVSGSGPDFLLPAPGNVHVLQRLVVALWSNEFKTIFGEYHDVYQISGFGNTSESTVTVDAETYIVFPNIYRSGIGDFFAIKME